MTDTSVKPAVRDDTMFEITQEIQRLLHVRSAQARNYGTHFLELWELATGHVGGGKLLRPKLLLGAFDALVSEQAGTTAPRTMALELAAALEILHYSFLLHDDVIDEDLLRRGKPNLVGHLAEFAELPSNNANKLGMSPASRLHWARSSAILVGDLMLSIAHQTFARADLTNSQRHRILDLLDAAVTETVAGEYCDVSLAHGCFTPDFGLVLDMTRMKTACYTFELPLRVAAALAGASPRIEQQLGEVGRHLGVAFQLQDDLLSAFGASEEHGKDQFSDFREAKETVLIAYARLTQQWPSIEQLLGTESFTVASGHAIQHLLIECGAREFIESMIEDQVRAAVTKLSEHHAALPAAVPQFMLSFVDSLERRVV